MSERTLTLVQYAGGSASLVLGGPRLFEKFANSYNHEESGFQRVAGAISPFLSRMQSWVGVIYKDAVVAVTPFSDDTIVNERLKSTSGIHPFVHDADAAYALFEGIRRTYYGRATRDCDIRIPVGDDRTFAVSGVQEALTRLGYNLEALHPVLFNLEGQSYPVHEYGRATPGRRNLFPEGSRLIDSIKESVADNGRRVLSPDNMTKLVERISKENYIARLEPSDVEGAATVHTRAFPVYGTYPINKVLPGMAIDKSPTAPIAVITREITSRETGRVTGLVVLEKYPYGFVEITDVCSVNPRTGNVIQNGSALAMVYEAARIANVDGYTTGYSDNIPLMGMNSLSRRLGHSLVGIHPVQVGLITDELERKIGRRPTYVDLMVWSGSIEFGQKPS